MVQSTYKIGNRRLRLNRWARELSATVSLSHRDFVQPLFVKEGIDSRVPLTNLNDVFNETVQSVLHRIEQDIQLGIHKFLLFPVPQKKSVISFEFVTSVLQTIKKHFGADIWIAADTCLCSYTDHGHCGLLNETGTAIDNDASVQLLAAYALQLAQAGADCIAPSDMMDGRIAAIREILDGNDLDHVSIMSYSAKFSSNFYGPFRDACSSAPSGVLLKDRRTYQLSPFSSFDAIRSTLSDREEGADIVMVKPSVAYIDIVKELKQKVDCPVAAYHVSGEYQAIELLAQNGMLQRENGHCEVWIALKRAGTDIIISYAARNAKQWIEQLDY